MTLIEKAGKGTISAEMKAVAKKEGVEPEVIRDGLAAGTIVIPKNKSRKGLDVEGIGAGLRTKVNANIGTSRDRNSLKNEIKKLDAALDAKADAIMDLSTGGNIPRIRQEILDRCPKPLGTVPIYEVFVKATGKGKVQPKFDPGQLFDVIEAQAEQGVDFITVHCGLTRVTLDRIRRQKRVLGIVSRGGSFIAAWMARTGNENPLYEHYDRLLKICRKHDVTLSLGDGLRSGAIADAADRPMIQEMIFLGELAQEAREHGVQAMIEGPGHMPVNLIADNVRLEKTVCNGAPYYVLGPLVTDVAPGYDHITSAIGGTIAAAAGVDFLCYVTPTEHLGLPGPADVREGVMASRIAAHAGDIVKFGHTDWDRKMSVARKDLDWDTMEKLAMDPQKFDIVKKDQQLKTKKKDDKTCSMCGEFCAVEVCSLIEQDGNL